LFELIELRRTEAQPAVLFKCDLQLTGFLVGQLAVFFRPCIEKLLQTRDPFNALLCGFRFHPFIHWFDAHGLTLVQRDRDIGNNHAIPDMPDKRRCARQMFR